MVFLAYFGVWGFSTLSFLVFFVIVFPLRRIPFFERFSLFSRDFRGSIGLKNPFSSDSFPYLFLPTFFRAFFPSFPGILGVR